VTGGAVFNQALREVRALDLSGDAERDFVAALEAALPGPSDLFYTLAHEASLPRAELLLRGAGLFVLFAAGNLADDLIDGDCDYLSRTRAIGPSVQFGLHHLGYAILLRSSIVGEAAARMGRHLALAGAAEHLELGGAWTAERFVRVAEGIAGLQWQAYLPVLWAGTGREDSGALGRTLGLALHLAEDIRTGDRRFVAMPPGDQVEVGRWGLTLARQLRASQSRCLAGVADAVEPAYEGVLR
jgi:hypothetical protein